MAATNGQGKDESPHVLALPYRPGLDPVALLTIAGVIALVGIAAAAVPTRRAAMLDPLTALRHE